MKDVTMDDARCLILWPEGTRGYDQDQAAIMYLLMVANTIGYGRLSQLAEQIRELWLHPERQAEFGAWRQEFLKMQSEVFKGVMNDRATTENLLRNSLPDDQP